MCAPGTDQLILESLQTGSELPAGSFLPEDGSCRHMQISVPTALVDKSEGQHGRASYGPPMPSMATAHTMTPLQYGQDPSSQFFNSV